MACLKQIFQDGSLFLLHMNGCLRVLMSSRGKVLSLFSLDPLVSLELCMVEFEMLL